MLHKRDKKVKYIYITDHRVSIVFMENGSTKHHSQLKSQLSGEDNNKTNYVYVYIYT